MFRNELEKTGTHHHQLQFHPRGLVGQFFVLFWGFLYCLLNVQVLYSGVQKGKSKESVRSGVWWYLLEGFPVGLLADLLEIIGEVFHPQRGGVATFQRDDQNVVHVGHF